MDSPQSVVSPFKTSVVSEPEKPKSDCFVRANSGPYSNGIEAGRQETNVSNVEDFIGVVEVYVHQARDIHNICIYHKQDVYAKLCLTSDPELAASTKTINGGGQNPVFNDKVQLNVRTVDASVKCEIWMLSRVKNYLEDQLLGFALVPMSEVLIKNGKLEKEFPLSSTDLFHSPAGFVKLSLSYSGDLPELMSLAANPIMEDTEITDSIPCEELDKMEFPDPDIANEDQMMVSEYIKIPCSEFESRSSESFVTADGETHVSSEVEVHAAESFSTAAFGSIQAQKLDSPPSSVSTNGVSSPSVQASSESSDAPATSESLNQEQVSASKEKRADLKDGETGSSGEVPIDTISKPVVTVNIPEQNVVQQDFVDMYMKSMQQFTESLAKMKLPVDIESPTSSGNSSSDQNLATPKTNGSRVFYGSRAFF
ncbi:uncharacterized protein LOC126786352 [Argentina anserina]|uniref:uncharacterized protein LOC126786352 n=1 Tax=Argentina anserina TaxID=57926 RepID=UPI00217686BC|nr:uncharacterized protein LOC126786352 [Potentilla anserina]XP_050368108.1 uncharacterized protein LOC126786352 [Potentilla anserina]XP_050368110.1 uncharacterized protein LOC126786352 [Potentilla anserina]